MFYGDVQPPDIIEVAGHEVASSGIAPMSGGTGLSRHELRRLADADTTQRLSLAKAVRHKTGAVAAIRRGECYPMARTKDLDQWTTARE